MRARAFFEDLCPALLEQRATLARHLGRRYAFTLDGDGGGTWTLDFDVCAVAQGMLPSALEVRTNVASFEALLAGELDVPAAIADASLRFRGDTRLLENLVKLTRPVVLRLV